MSEFVLDNSVAMRWCFDSGNNAYADRLLEQLEVEQSVAYVPSLWLYKASSVLARAEIKGYISAQTAADFLEDIAALDIRVDPDSATHALTDVYQLAVRHRLTSYDAAYLELALDGFTDQVQRWLISDLRISAGVW